MQKKMSLFHFLSVIILSRKKVLFSYLTHLLTDNSFLSSPSVIRRYVKSWQCLGDVAALFEAPKEGDCDQTVAQSPSPP